jgi:hypothetical protein
MISVIGERIFIGSVDKKNAPPFGGGAVTMVKTMATSNSMFKEILEA